MLNFSLFSMITPLGGLLSETFDLLKRRAQVILVAAVVLGLLLSALNMYLIPVKTGMFSGMFGNLGMNTERLEELSKRMEQGDEAALNEMMKEFEAGAKKMENLPKGDAQAIAAGFYASMFSVAFLWSLVAGALFLLGMTFYYVAALKEKDLPSTLTDAVRVLPAMIGLQIWVFLRSFAWVPFIGIVFAIVLGPRFVLSQVILLQEKMSVLQSASESYQRTGGYWGKIVGNEIVAAILGGIGFLTLIFVMGFLGSAVSLWISGIVTQLFIVWMVVFTTKLALAIMKNPQTA